MNSKDKLRGCDRGKMPWAKIMIIKIIKGLKRSANL